MQSEEHNNFESLDETSRKGLCWFELKRTGMTQWGVCRRVTFGGQKGDSTPQLSSSVVEEVDERDGGEALTVAESLETRGIQKGKHLPLGQLSEVRAGRVVKRRQSIGVQKRKQHKQRNSVDRWSAERYKLAELNMLEIMKTEGAVFEKPISRPALRMAARKRIGDTGLLDHLLKHIDGKVAPGGAERFRRCYNTNGIMEYWLESADLVNVKREAGVADPNWVPPSWWKPGGVPPQESGEFKLFKEEIEKMKSDILELQSKQKEQYHSNSVEEMHKELVRWKAKTDQRLMEISNSLSSMQDMYKELVTWKAKVEQQLFGISNSLNSMQVPKQCTTFSPTSERWEDWLEGTSLDGIQEEGFVPWLDSADLVNNGQETMIQGLYSDPQPPAKPSSNTSENRSCVREMELLKEEMAKMRRDVQDLAPRRQDEDVANMTPDSSVTANPKLDLDNSVLLFQEMFKELMQWKAKTEQQLVEFSNTVSAMQASRL